MAFPHPPAPPLFGISSSTAAAVSCPSVPAPAAAPTPVDYPGGEESEDKPKSSGLKVQSRVSRILRRQSQEVATTGAAEEVEGEEGEEPKEPAEEVKKPRYFPPKRLPNPFESAA